MVTSDGETRELVLFSFLAFEWGVSAFRAEILGSVGWPNPVIIEVSPIWR